MSEQVIAFDGEEGEIGYYYQLRVTSAEYIMRFSLWRTHGVPEKLLHGTLKWDGCVDWSPVAGAYHFCDVEDLRFLNRVFEIVWSLGPEKISKWERDFS
jgi:hypothetical protein